MRNFVPRFNQTGATNAVMDYWNGNKGLHPVTVIPTGGGKGITIAMICKRIIEVMPHARIGVCIHTKELVEQNYKEIIEYWPEAPAGVWSASVGRKDKNAQILVAGIQSLSGNLEKTGGFHFLLIDEAQRVDFNDKPDTQYQALFEENRKYVRGFRSLAITATPWRGNNKPIFGWWEAHFDEVVYSVSITEMIEHGFLVPPVPRTHAIRIDTSKLKVSKITGDYTEKALADISNDDHVNIPAVESTIEELRTRNCALVFTTSVEHAENVCRLFNERGTNARFIHGKMTKKQRTEIVQDYKAGKFRVLVNCMVLLVGFDHKPLDLIVNLRPTKSTLLWIQLLGRGMRVWLGSNKVDCLVLDFTSSSEEIGPIDEIEPPAPPVRKMTKDEEIIGMSGIKECPECNCLLSVQARECECGWSMPALHRSYDLADAPTDAPLLAAQAGIPAWSEVTNWRIEKWRKHGKPDTVKITFYRKGKELAPIWLAFNSFGPPRKSAIAKWKTMCVDLEFIPESTHEALQNVGRLRMPSAIKLKRNGKYHDIVGITYEELPKND